MWFIIQLCRRFFPSTSILNYALILLKVIELITLMLLLYFSSFEIQIFFNRIPTSSYRGICRGFFYFMFHFQHGEVRSVQINNNNKRTATINKSIIIIIEKNILLSNRMPFFYRTFFVLLFLPIDPYIYIYIYHVWLYKRTSWYSGVLVFGV